MMMLASLVGKAQIISVNTDLLMDGCQLPNFGVELGLNSSSSLSANVMFGKKAFFKDFSIAALQPEWRYYFSGRTMYHHFVGIGGVLATYDAKLDNKVYKGDGAGVGVTFGYALPLAKHLNLDFHAGCGLFMYRQKEYFESKGYDEFHDDGKEKTNSHGSHILPTRIGISLTYIIK